MAPCPSDACAKNEENAHVLYDSAVEKSLKFSSVAPSGVHGYLPSSIDGTPTQINLLVRA